MPDADSNLDAHKSVQRIQQAFSADNLQELMHRLAGILGRHMESVQASSGDVLNWNEPPENCRLA